MYLQTNFVKVLSTLYLLFKKRVCLVFDKGIHLDSISVIAMVKPEKKEDTIMNKKNIECKDNLISKILQGRN